MYFSTGLIENIKNVFALGALAQESSDRVPTAERLKFGLFEYIKRYQNDVVLSQLSSKGPLFIEDLNEKKKLANIFAIDSSLNDFSQGSIIEALEFENSHDFKSKLDAALLTLQDDFPELKMLFDIVINYIFFARSSRAAGGSTSGGIGVLWLNPKSTWTGEDWIEIIVHEMTHQLLFIDERRYRHYLDYSKVALPENFAYSTILAKRRPLDKVIHSLFVGYNLLELRVRSGKSMSRMRTIHPESDVILSRLKDTFQSLNSDLRGLLSVRMKFLLDRCEMSLRSLEGQLR